MLSNLTMDTKPFNEKVHRRANRPCRKCGDRRRYITTRNCVTCAIEAVARARLRKLLGDIPSYQGVPK